ncbi:MAG: endonuclease domain-containing protein [Gammaproteobacteria bacterium]|nr:endonuclease domain-containing protein [Gammaproteobacteria bacterium]
MQGAEFKARQADCFSFSSYDYEPASGVATLSYRVDGQNLQEKITFPWAPWPVDASRQAAFFKALEVLHLIAGISYYKAGLARHVDLGECEIDPLLADFLNEFYLQGLGEFAYVNQLDLSAVINFQANIPAESAPNDETSGGKLKMALDLPERALVAMGGGKDSLVCLQMLRNAGIEVQPACVGGSALIGETVKSAGLPLIRVQRQLAQGLTAMNAEGAWNGHVPVTAINSAILLCAGLLYGYRNIVFANESSANEATLQDEQGREVNHQYSKSIGFEKAFRDLIRQRVSPDIEYFSLLRPYSEIAITRKFVEMSRFHPVFSSCNRNFHLDGPRIEGRWCQDCPKCRFAALALAVFMTPEQLVAIQGKDLLDDEEQVNGFKALCGLENHKPFECVGSIAESRAAMKYLSRSPGWQRKRVVRLLAEYKEIRHGGELVLQPDFESEHCIPEVIAAELNAI